jgi:hypothetical protein
LLRAPVGFVDDPENYVGTAAQKYYSLEVGGTPIILLGGFRRDSDMDGVSRGESDPELGWQMPGCKPTPKEHLGVRRGSNDLKSNLRGLFAKSKFSASQAFHFTLIEDRLVVSLLCAEQVEHNTS